MDKIEKSIQSIKKAEPLALKYQSYGFHLAFSGGKDSQVIHELCKMTGVKFKAFFYKTSIDPPELLSFVRDHYPGVEWLKPKYTMFQLILKKGMLPLRQYRFCCDFLKERQGLNAVVITGITKAESPKRRKRKEFETSCKLGKDKIILNPILDWTLKDIFTFLKNRKIKICPLYKTQKRIGCIGCPMSPKTMRKDFKERPNFKKAYINTAQKLMDKGKYLDFESPEDIIDWWASGISKQKWLMDKKQPKLFENYGQNNQ